MLDSINALGDIPNSEKALILSAVTNSPINLGELENLLDSEEILWHDEISGNWTGPLVTYMTGNSDAISDGIKELLRHMSKSRSTQIDSHLAEWGLKCKGLLEGLVLVSVISQDQSDAVLSLGGGRKHGDVSVADIEQAISDHEDELAEKAAQQAAAEALMAERAQIQALMEEFQGLVNTHVAPLSGGINPTSDRATWAAAIDAIRSNWSV